MKWYIFVANQRVILFNKWLDVVIKLLLLCKRIMHIYCAEVVQPNVFQPSNMSFTLKRFENQTFV